MRPRAVSLGCLALSLVWLSVAAASSPGLQDATPEQAAFFESKIRPIFANNCYACHGPQVQSGGLRFDMASGVQKAIAPGDPERSALIKAVRQTGPVKMPPQGKKLRPEEIAVLEAWVKMGAPWPKAAGPVKAAPELWSLKPVKKLVVPKVAGAKSPIDSFILAGLSSKKLKPAAQADPRTLLRRVTYDLTGLPPSQAEMDAFLADKSPNAYEKAVDRLLNSPRYGERWARLWLDVARYADTKGYVFEEDRNYYNAYTYRDWVIRAFNDDLPYDKFIVQQLAADCLPEVKNGEDKRPLAALGFLTVGRRFLNNQPDIIDDRIDVTMRGFQGFTVACARCHDHKFDPIPTQDYYSLYGVFASTIEAAVPISEKSIRDPWERYSKQLAGLQEQVKILVFTEIKRLRGVVKDPEGSKTLSDDVKQTLQMLREEQFPDGPKMAKLMTAFKPEERTRLQSLAKEVEALKGSAPTTPEFAMAMADSPRPSDVNVFKRGNPGNRGEVAPRRFLAALCSSPEERPKWTEGSGRLQLAEAIASTDNPLTARVFVNRVWQGHFGAGLVRTPSDFGHQGEKPTHSELLDWLASQFMESGWSIKKLHRLIVTSATYRQSSTVSKEAMNADPENRLWSHQNRRRLDMEQMRDSLMLASGRLDLKQVGGRSVDLWAQPFSGRRAVYGFIERQNLPGIFKTFDFASPDITSPRRFMTTVPQQALFFMNSPFSVEQARALAERPDIASAKDDAQRVRRLYQALFARLPDAEETAAAMAYLQGPPVAAVESPWRYGYGSFDPGQKRLVSFTPFPFFGEGSYRAGKAFPDSKLGYLVLNAGGGHPGRDASLCAVRRWVAPESMTVRIAGVLGHRQNQGDGVRGRVATRTGVLGEWQAKNSTAKTEVPSFTVQKGDTVDFVVDCIGNEGFDSFSWAPVVVAESKVWNATADFAPPPPPGLTRLALYAQALMMTNEFLFVD